MTDLTQFPITRKWPPRHPDRIQLYSLPTPNGIKVSVMLEETGLPYEAHRVAFDSNDQKSPEFTALNPYQKIPAIIDPAGPGDSRCPSSNRVRSSSIWPTNRAASCQTMRRSAITRCSG
jgi:GSH-dependent disulfide-bond oxidoreductase